MSFGTGAVKITPAHDPNDYGCGKRHSLDFINILTPEGQINDNGAPFVGMMRWVGGWVGGWVDKGHGYVCSMESPNQTLPSSC